jgi:predicted transcriptional regulator
MSDRHKRNPVTVRLPEDLRAWVKRYAAVTGRPVNAVIVEAITEKRDRGTCRPAARGDEP